MINQIIETIKLKDDLRVLGFQVKDCSTGIGEAFENLVNRLPGGFDRSYYGISQMTKDGMIYKAAALENYDGEAEQYQCERFTIEKGEYLAVTLYEWRKNLDSIKEIFHGMFQEFGVDETKPCIEWYKNDDEMVCMVKLKPRVNGFHHNK